MGLLSELFVTFSAKGVTETSAAFDTVEGRAKRTSSAIQDLGRQTASAMRAATATMVGFSTAGLAGTVQGAQLTYQFQRMSREIASVALPVVQKLTGAVKGVADWFHGLSRGQQDTIMKFGLVTVGATLAITVFGKLATGIRSIIELYKALNIQMTITKGLALVGIGGAVKGAAAAGVGAAAGGTAAAGVAAAGGGAATVAGGAAAAGGVSALLPVAAVVVSVVAALGVAKLLHKAKYGDLEEESKGLSSTELYAKSEKLRKNEGFKDAGFRAADKYDLLSYIGMSIRPMSDQLQAKAIDAHRGRRDVAMAGGSFEGITDTFRRMQTATMRLGYKEPSEKTDAEILDELRKINGTLKTKLDTGMA